MFCEGADAMKYSNLYDLITCLEYGNNIHICVVFLNKYGNFMTNLPTDKVIHSREFCTFKIIFVLRQYAISA